MAMIKMIKTVRLRYFLSCPKNKTTTAINAGPTYGRGGGGHRGKDTTSQCSPNRHHGDNVKHRQVTELVEESEEDEDPPVPVTALPQITVVLESAKQVVGFNQM